MNASSSLTGVTMVRSATYDGSSSSACASLGASTCHQIAWPPCRQEPNVGWCRSGLEKPFQAANDGPHSDGS